jgi:hypothetical protein
LVLLILFGILRVSGVMGPTSAVCPNGWRMLARLAAFVHEPY